MTINEFLDKAMSHFEELTTEATENMHKAAQDGDKDVYTFYRGECMAYATAIGYLKFQKQLLEVPDENI